MVGGTNPYFRWETDIASARDAFTVSNTYGHIFSIVAEGNSTILKAEGSSTARIESPSDYRLKQNIADISNASNVVSQLRPVTYEMKAFPGDVKAGFIAHELQEFVPDAVRGTKDATEAIGTLRTAEGSILEEDVTEPLAEEMTYEEQVEVTPYVAAVEATYDEEGNELTPYVEEVGATYETVTRTKTWTATGNP